MVRQEQGYANMKDISRREILRGATLSGLGVVGMGSGVAAAAPQDDVLDLLNGDDESGGGGDDCDVIVDPSTATGPDTIQEAVDTASPGTRDDLTTICVVSGTFDESVTIGTDGIAIVGEGTEKTQVTSSGTTFQVDAADVLLFKLGIDGTAGRAVDVGPGTGIRNCRVTAEDTTAVTSSGDSFSVIQSEFVDLNGFDDTGVAISAEGVRADLDQENEGIFVSNTEFTDFRHSVKLEDCKKVAIKRNSFLRSWYSAIQVEAVGDDVDLIFIGNNEFRNNTNAIIFFEDGDSRSITRSGAVENIFDDFFWGVLTSTQKVPFDFDKDGEDEMVEVPGELGGGVISAQCNYWGRPTGPRAEENDLTLDNPVPGWVVPRPIKSGLDQVVPKKADKTVEGAVDYRPWQLEPPIIDDLVPGWFPPGAFLLPGSLQLDCVGGIATENI